MIDLIDKEEIVRKAWAARSFQESDVYQGAVIAVVTRIVTSFLLDNLDDEQVLELRRQYLSLEAIDNDITAVVEDGEIAEADDD